MKFKSLHESVGIFCIKEKRTSLEVLFIVIYLCNEIFKLIYSEITLHCIY